MKQSLSVIAGVTLALLTMISPSASFAEEREGYQISSGADWRSYGLYSTRWGFGYNLEVAKIFYATNRAELTAGGRVAYYPNERAYRWTFGSAIGEVGRDNRLFYAGLPLVARYHFSEGGFAPFAEFKNLLDVRVLQQTEKPDTGSVCFSSGFGPQTCRKKDELEEVAGNSLVVWRQAVSLGFRIRLRERSILLSEGIQWDVTPARESISYGPPVRGLYLSSKLGLSF